jgi:predicted acyl esterase
VPGEFPGVVSPRIADVLVPVSDVLTAALAVAGNPVANLFASTTGTDADWVVKVIDLHADEVPTQPELGGYQLAVSMDMLRGHYCESFEKLPQPASTPAAAEEHYVQEHLEEIQQQMEAAFPPKS